MEGSDMTIVRDIVEQKGHSLHSVAPDDTVLDVLRLMAKENIGAVLVMSGDILVGIFTERHYARNVFLEGKASPTTPAQDVMESHVIHVEPEHSVEACMALMTENHIRHLPVLSDGRLVGMVSIGDLMRSMIEERQFNIDQLVQYVRG